MANTKKEVNFITAILLASLTAIFICGYFNTASANSGASYSDEIGNTISSTESTALFMDAEQETFHDDETNVADEIEKPESINKLLKGAIISAELNELAESVIVSSDIFENEDLKQFLNYNATPGICYIKVTKNGEFIEIIGDVATWNQDTLKNVGYKLWESDSLYDYYSVVIQ